MDRLDRERERERERERKEREWKGCPYPHMQNFSMKSSLSIL